MRNACNKHPITLLEYFTSYFDDLHGRLTGPKNHLGKPLSQSTMLIHLGKTKILNRLLTQCRQHLRLAYFAGTELLEQLSCLIWGHDKVYEELPDFLQQKRQ